MTKNKYATIQDLVPGKNFDFFNNFGDQVFKNKTINIDEVGHDWFDCLNDEYPCARAIQALLAIDTFSVFLKVE